MKIHLSILTILLVVKLGSAQGLTHEQQEVVTTFVNCVKDKNLDQLKTLVRYPLRRTYPLPDIKTEAEFVSYYPTLFDDILVDMIVESNIENDWDAVGWRGIAVGSGTIWLDYEGFLIGVNHQSNSEKQIRGQLIEADKRTLHVSLQTFDQPVLQLETPKFRIRIDKLRNGQYRYASWSIDSQKDEEPDLVIENGTWTPEGGGNERFDFVNGLYTYQCFIHVIGEEDTPPAELIVYKNEKEILRQPAQIIQK